MVVWGRASKTFKLGTKVRERRAPDDPMISRKTKPELRIIDDELWFAVHARFRVQDGQAKRPGRRARHLLSGLGRCVQCGGPMVAHIAKWGSQRVPQYQCGYARQRGPEVCKNPLRRPLHAVNEVVLDWIKKELLAPAFVEGIIARVIRELAEEKPRPVDAKAAEKEAAKVRKEVDRLVAALATLDDKPDAIVKGIATVPASVSPGLPLRR